MKKIYLFDTSAILTFFLNEDGADEVANLLKKSSISEVDIYASFMSYYEIFYRMWKNHNYNVAQKIYNDLVKLPIEKAGYEKAFNKAVEIKAKNNLSVVDSWVAATAFLLKAILVHKDPEFEQLPYIEQLILPYK